MSDEISYVGDHGGDPFLDVTFYPKLIDGKEYDCIKIYVPGDKTFHIDTGVEETHKIRFRRQWEAYKNLQTITGTSLEEWEELNESLVNELKYQGFRYIEQIASAPDSAFSRIMGGTQLREKAKAYINRGKVNSEALIAQQAEQIAKLQEQMALLLETQPDTSVKPATVKQAVPTKVSK